MGTWSHIFTTIFSLDEGINEAVWYAKVTELIEKQQTSPIWMSESKPDESMADEFLFPMTSRYSYSSSLYNGDSDGEFCEPETPIVSRQPSMIIDPAKLDSRYNSDPNLASQQDKKSSINGIPDYNAPPPNSAINPQVSHTPKPVLTSEPRRRSSRTGNGPEMPQYATLPLQSDSVDELPLPPSPLNNIENPYRYEAIPERKSRTSSTSMSSSSSAKRSQSQPPKSLPPTLNGSSSAVAINGSGSNGLTPVNGNGSNSMVIQQPAPTIERHKKPSGVPSNGYHTYNSHRSSSQLQYPNESTLDKRNHMRDMKMTIYDAYGNGQVVNTPPTSNPSNTASISNGIYNTATRYHRSQSQDPTYKSLHTVQPQKSLNSSNGGVIGKPVPPPKPKSYPNPPQSRSTHFATTSFVESNYMNSLTQPYSNGNNGITNGNNGITNGINGNTRQNQGAPINDDDSGQGSSLDRDY